MYALLKVILSDETFYISGNEDYIHELKEKIQLLLELDSTLTKEQLLDDIELYLYDAAEIDVYSVIDAVKVTTN